MRTIPAPPTVAYTTNENIFKAMDIDSLNRNLASYIKTLKEGKLTDDERKGYEHGYNLCKEEFDFRNKLNKAA